MGLKGSTCASDALQSWWCVLKPGCSSRASQKTVVHELT